MTVFTETSRYRLKSRPGIVLEFDPPHWDDEPPADTIGRVYKEKGLKIYKLPGDLPEDTDLETIEPVSISPDGTVLQWYYTCTSDPEAETTQNHNRKLGEELRAQGLYGGAITEPEPARLTDKGKQWRRLEKSFKFSSIATSLVILVILVVWGIIWGLSRLNNSDPKQVAVSLVVLPEVSFQYTLPASQIDKQIKTISTNLILEAVGEATGTVQVPDAVAKGKVRFLNAGTSPFSLPAGTVIASANGINYKLVQAVTVPSVNIQAAKVVFIDATVQADQAGPQGNLPGGIGTFVFQGAVSVGGIEAINGGTNRTIKTVTAEDINRLKSKLLEQAKGGAAASFDGKLAADQKRWGVVELGEPEFSMPEANSEQPSGQFKGKLTLRLTATCYRPKELLKLVVAPPGVAGLSLEYGTARWGDLSKDWQDTFKLSYTRSLQVVRQTQPLFEWQGSRAEFEELLTELKSAPGLRFVGIMGDLTRDWQGLVQVTFQLK